MLAPYIPLVVIILLAVVLAVLVVVIGHSFGPRRPTPKKALPYESGMVPYGPGTRRMTVRYYLIAVLVHPVRHRSGLLPALGGRLPRAGLAGLGSMMVILWLS